MKRNIELHLFTNSTIYAPNTDIIESTYESFKDVFDNKGTIATYVWCDPRPYVDASKKYINNLMSIFGSDGVSKTRSLSDGYIRSIRESRADLMIMLEHDWEFQKERIEHTLDDIADEFDHNKGLMHFRFNRRRNLVKGSDEWISETQGRHMKYCVTPSLSNNPHIIHRRRYKKSALPCLKVSKGSQGIESTLSRNDDLTGVLYGPMNHPNTVRHTNGRGEDRKKNR